jgi:hypothetical protein
MGAGIPSKTAYAGKQVEGGRIAGGRVEDGQMAREPVDAGRVWGGEMLCTRTIAGQPGEGGVVRRGRMPNGCAHQSSQKLTGCVRILIEIHRNFHTETIKRSRLEWTKKVMNGQPQPCADRSFLGGIHHFLSLGFFDKLRDFP